MTMPLPRLTPEQFEAALIEACAQVVAMLRLGRDAFLRQDQKLLERVTALGQDVHLREKRLTQHVALQMREAPWSLGAAEALALAPAALERAGDAAEAVARCTARMIQEGAAFSEGAMGEIRTLFDVAADLVETVGAAIKTRTPALVRHLREDGARLQSQANAYETSHEDRLLSGVCLPRSSSIYLAMLDGFREVERYTRRIADALEKPAARA